jgi:hypothetical protein
MSTENVHVAVTPADDPAADLQRSHGRFLYFGTVKRYLELREM